MNFKRNSVLAALFLVSINCIAQNDKMAKEAMAYGNMHEAIRYLTPLLKADPRNYEYNALAGLAYLNSNIDKAKAVEHFEQAIKAKNPDPYIYYDLGRAYLLNYRFDDAIGMFTKFIDKGLKEDKTDLPARRYLEMCENAKILMQLRSHVTLQNIGIEVNTESPEYNPYIDESESVLYFSSRRPKNLGAEDFDGFKPSDIHFSNFDGKEWKSVKRLPAPINTSAMEEIVGLSADESMMFLYINNGYDLEDVIVSTKKKRNFQRPEGLSGFGGTSFSKKSASVSPCGNWLFFSSDKLGGFGGSDIYYAKKLPNGDWGVPVNAGNSINTEYDDNFPYLAPDEKTFFFCSQGHNSMGGYDIFKSTWDIDEQTFTIPDNLGYPVNTPGDNKTISVSKSGRYAYISDFRENGQGDLDIYKVVFLDMPPPYFVIKSNVLSADSIPVLPDQIDHKADYKIVVTDARSKEQTGIFRPNLHNGQFSLILTPGFYLIDLYADNEKVAALDYTIEDREPFAEALELNIILPDPQ